MSISIGIMTHPKRQDNCSKLVKQIPSAFHISDVNSEGCWSNARKCWKYGIQTGADHILILQDDITLCDNFEQHINNIIKARPNDPISFFTPFNNFTINKDIRWLKMDEFLFTQAFIMPRNVAIKAFEWIEAVLKDYTPKYAGEKYKELDDVKIGAFLNVHKIPVYVTLPNLVEHDDDNNSLLNHVYRRKSVWWEKDVSQYDWKNLTHSVLNDPKPRIIY